MAPGGADGVGVGNIMIKRESIIYVLQHQTTNNHLHLGIFFIGPSAFCVCRPLPHRGNSFRKTAKHGYNSESFNISNNSNEMMEVYGSESH